MRHCLMIAAIALLASSLSAASCTGECKTIEYRIDEALSARWVTYERNDHTYFIDDWQLHYRQPKEEVADLLRTSGRATREEANLISTLRNLAQEWSETRYATAMEIYQERTSDAGTTNTCSSGCDCAEGTFTETPDSVFTVHGESGERTIEVRGGRTGHRTIGYYYMWYGTGTIDYTDRVKQVDCVYLEP